MIKSMTGYGKATTDHESFSVQVEVKTLNSKFLDAIVKLPRPLSRHEIAVRNLASDVLQRGKVLLTVDYAAKGELAEAPTINAALLKAYYQAYRSVADELQENPVDLFRTAAQSPDVVQPSAQPEIDEQAWAAIQTTIRDALNRCDEFRQQEGAALQKDMEECIHRIKSALAEIQLLIPERDQHVRQRLQEHLNEQTVTELIDQNRLEQEMIYYLEKLDVNEEVIRLTNHLDYFLDVLHQPASQGKKLGFIGQEIGREINTIGSKANDASMQRHVVNMKEDLEKIKEQTLNIL
ncbi:MAG: YicC/YloC family endoribonuclease [Tunicatimonas sp.]